MENNDNKVCRDCGRTEDIYVKILETNTEVITYQCYDCFKDSHDKSRMEWNGSDE